MADFPGFVGFHTARLVVRRMVDDDAPELAAISDVPEISQWMIFMEGGFPLEKARALISSQQTSNERFFAVRIASGAMAGALGMVDHPDQTLEVGYWFGLDHQGKGYALEALSGLLDQIAADPKLAQRQVIAEAKADNAPSIRLLVKTGFQATGRPGHRPNRVGFALVKQAAPGAKSN